MVDVNRSIQVLNISNVNAQGKTVLNDGKLLELIQKYPFLYNTRVRAYNDNDYTAWAWKNINDAFKRSYGNDPSALFTTEHLINRWHVLKPLIQCLSKAYDLEAIPESLRNSVIKISTELENQSFNAIAKQNNGYQSLLLQNMGAIAELPMEKKLALERDVLEFILSSELEKKQTIKLDENAWTEIDQDTEEFLNQIGYRNVLLTAFTKCDKIHSNQHAANNANIKRSCGWVPLKDVHNNIKPCRVRVERINIEDYLPLAQIMQKNKNRIRHGKGASLSR